MKRAVLVMMLLAVSAHAQTVNTARVAEDAVVVDRVAEASKRDLPGDLLRRIVNEDIDILRGKRNDGTFEYATYERLEAGRTTTSFSIQPRKDKMDTVELRGAFIYRIVLDTPKRRLVVGKNRPVWVERVDVEYVPENAGATQRQSFEVKAWLQPGQVKPVDLPVIARQANVKVIATADEKSGYGNLDVALIHARIVDNADSPYAEAVAAEKAILRAIDNGDIPSMRAMAQRVRDSLGGAPRAASTPGMPPPPSSSVTVTAPRDTATQLELQTELQVIEDLLTGNESERREGMDRLHQLIRRLRR
jgi:hypothetical protein